MAGGKLMATGPSAPTFRKTPKCRKGWSYSNYDRKCVKTIDAEAQPGLTWRQKLLMWFAFPGAEPSIANGDIDMSGWGKKGGEIKNGKIYTRDEKLSSIKSRTRR